MQDSTAQTFSTPDQVAAVTALLMGESKPKAAGPAPVHDDHQEEDLTHAGAEADADANAGAAPKTEAPEDAAPKIDYKMKVPIENMEPVTLAELKDYYKANRPNELEIQDRENKTMRDLASLREMATALQALPPETIQQFHQDKVQRDAREQAALLEVMPTWKDPEVFKAATAGLEDMVKRYRLPLNVNPMDSHAWIKQLHDHATLRAKYAAAVALAGKPKTPRDPSGRPRSHVSTQQQTQALADRAKKSGNVSDKTAAITALLNS